MASLTFVPYAPKPSKQPSRSIGKRPFKSILKQPNSLNKNLQINSSSAPVQMPLVSREVLGDDDWWQEAARDSEAIVQDAQASGDDLDRPRDQAAESVYSDDDKDFLAVARLFSTKDKHILAEKGSSVKSNTIEQDFDDDLFGSYRSRAGSSHDEPIVLESDDKSDGDDNDLDTRHPARIPDYGYPGNDARNLENPPTLSNCTANELDDSDNGIDKSPRSAKRQRSASPGYNPELRHTSISPLPHNEDGTDSGEIIHHSDPNESGDDGISSKRRKVSAPLTGRTALNRHNGQSRHSPTPISEDDEDDGTLSISADGKLASTARTTPAFESAPRTESQLSPQVIDTSQDWEVRKIIGKEDVGGVLHFLVDWHPTLLPEHLLGHAKELVDKFEARLRAQRGVKNARGGRGLKRGGRMVVKADASDGPQQRRPRGRPRKQVKLAANNNREHLVAGGGARNNVASAPVAESRGIHARVRETVVKPA